MTLAQIVAAYIRDHRRDARAEAKGFRQLPSLKEAIRRAALCHRFPDGKRHSHQCRIPLAALADAERRLQNASEALSAAADFQVLHHTVDREIGKIRGIGELCVYDIAHRIGAFRGLKPTLVYVHRGTRDGARILRFKGNTLDPKQLPAAFSRLTPAEIEDCLCIYKNALASDHFRTRVLHRASSCNYTRKNRVRKCCRLCGKSG